MDNVLRPSVESRHLRGHMRGKGSAGGPAQVLPPLLEQSADVADDVDEVPKEAEDGCLDDAPSQPHELLAAWKRGEAPQRREGAAGVRRGVLALAPRPQGLVPWDLRDAPPTVDAVKLELECLSDWSSARRARASGRVADGTLPRARFAVLNVKSVPKNAARLYERLRKRLAREETRGESGL